MSRFTGNPVCGTKSHLLGPAVPSFVPSRVARAGLDCWARLASWPPAASEGKTWTISSRPDRCVGVVAALQRVLANPASRDRRLRAADWPVLRCVGMWNSGAPALTWATAARTTPAATASGSSAPVPGNSPMARRRCAGSRRPSGHCLSGVKQTPGYPVRQKVAGLGSGLGRGVVPKRSSVTCPSSICG
jgi:hypothetical protein